MGTVIASWFGASANSQELYPAPQIKPVVVTQKIEVPTPPAELKIVEPIVTPEPSAAKGTKEAWMTAAGIPQSDWQYVDCVINGCQGVSPEGGWHGTERWNTTGSGAYGLCQALPATKMASAGADYMTNPVTQLKWCHQYAQDRYGSWAAAWNFRKCTGSCYSTYTGRNEDKDHTWW